MRLLVIFASLLSVFGYSAGVDTCMNAPNHGSWGNGTPFNLQLLSGNQTVTSYTPNTTYSLVLSGNTAFRGFITTAGNKSGLFTDVASQPLGNLHMDTNDLNVRRMTSCPGLTQVSNVAKRQVKALWTAPASGNVTFSSIIVVTQGGSNYRASLSVHQIDQNATHSATPSTLPSIISSVSRSATTSVSPTITVSSTASERKSSSETRSATMSISVSASIGLSSTSSHTITESSTISPTFSETMTASSSITLSATNSPPITPTETPDGTPTQTPAGTPSETPSGSSTPRSTPEDLNAQQTADMKHSAMVGVLSVLGGVGLAGIGMLLFIKSRSKRHSLSSRNIIDFVKPTDVTKNPLKTETKTEEMGKVV